MSLSRYTPLLLGVLTVAAGRPSEAQVPSRPAVVQGRVLDAATRLPLPYTLVDIVDQERRAETDANGLFRIEGLSPQLVTVRLRQIGYPVVERSLNLFSGRESQVEYVLAKPPPTLAEIRVRARPSPALENVLMAGFEDRKRLGIGKFYDEADIRRHVQRRVPDLLMDAPGVRLIQGRGGAYHLASGRMQVGTGGGRTAGACYLQVVVDGMTVWSPEHGNPRSSFGPPDLAHLVPVSDLVGVEVYSGVAGVPLLYRREGNSCGAVLFWTRRGDAIPILR